MTQALVRLRESAPSRAPCVVCSLSHLQTSVGVGSWERPSLPTLQAPPLIIHWEQSKVCNSFRYGLNRLICCRCVKCMCQNCRQFGLPLLLLDKTQSHRHMSLTNVHLGCLLRLCTPSNKETGKAGDVGMTSVSIWLEFNL